MFLGDNKRWWTRLLNGYDLSKKHWTHKCIQAYSFFSSLKLFLFLILRDRQDDMVQRAMDWTWTQAVKVHYCTTVHPQSCGPCKHFCCIVGLNFFFAANEYIFWIYSMYAFLSLTVLSSCHGHCKLSTVKYTIYIYIYMYKPCIVVHAKIR